MMLADGVCIKPLSFFLIVIPLQVLRP